MSFRDTFNALFGAPPDVAWPAMPTLPAGTRMRRLEVDDHARCVEIYRANEPGRFPPGFEPELQSSLTRSDYLWVALCVEDQLMAFGGITRMPSFRVDHAWLIFGMVDPARHGHGLGSWLLLARLCALPPPIKPVKVMMSNVASTQAFFERFGFVHQGRQHMGHHGIELDSSAAVLRQMVWRRGRELLQARGLSYGEPMVPVMDLLNPPGGKPPDAEGPL